MNTVQTLSRTAHHDGQRLRATYEVASTTEDNLRRWANADSRSAMSLLTKSVRRTLRNRARFESRNNSYCAGIVQTVANDVIGTGPKLQVMTGNDKVDKEIEDRFWEATEEMNFAGKLLLARQARVTDGESFLLMVDNERFENPTRIDLMILEADQIADPLSSLPIEGTAVDGIHFDRSGNPLWYSVLKEHPGSGLGYLATSDRDAVKVPAELMLHYCRPTRPGDRRPAPEITPALTLFLQLRRFTEATIGAAELAASFAGVLKTQQLPDAESMDDGVPFDIVDVEPRSFMNLPKGWDMTQLRSEHPATTYEMFKKTLLQEIARCLCMPYNVASGDSSSYNYSSGRLDRMNWERRTSIDRRETEQLACNPVYRAWWRMARLIPGYLSPAARQIVRPPNRVWYWDGAQSIDPLKDAKARETELATGQITFGELCASSGRDWREVAQQMAVEKAQFAKLGLPYQFTQDKTGATDNVDENNDSQN